MRLDNEVIENRQVRVNKFRVDLETKNYMVEVKTGTYLTGGTAHEKILGTPLKYANVPTLTNKRLYILCIAGAEHYMRNVEFEDIQLSMIENFKSQGIEYRYATDILADTLTSITSSITPYPPSCPTSTNTPFVCPLNTYVSKRISC